jgi:5-(carboxyamino)imidazole ribonucleotide mutase
LRRFAPQESKIFMNDISTPPLVGVIMGSKSDWETMRHAHETLTNFGVPHECKIVSAHRTPDLMMEYAESAEVRCLEVIIAGAGAAAHLPGMVASYTTLPVLGVPVESHALRGQDSLLSIVQMPAGIPVGTLAIGKAGAVNAALLAIAILANSRHELRLKLHMFREEQAERVRADVLPLDPPEATA